MSILNSRQKQHGVSLIELIMFMVIVSVAMASILMVMNKTTRGSADPLLRKQALAAAYSLLEEIELQDFSPVSAAVAVTQANRASAYHIISNYHGFSTSGIFAVNDPTSASAVLPNYNASVTVVATAMSGIPAASAVQINVTVTAPQGLSVTATGYRTAY